MKKFAFIMTLAAAVLMFRAEAQDCTVTLPFIDSFEGQTLNPCWTVILSDTASSLPLYGVSNEAYSDGQQCLMLIPLYSNNYDLYLITPELPVSGTKSVSFDHRGYWYAETFVVGYSTTTPDLAAFTWGDTIVSPAVEYPWNLYQNHSIPGDAKYVAIHHTSSDGFVLFIDHFVVEESASCMAPYALGVPYVTATTAGLTWSQSTGVGDLTLYYISDADSNVTAVPSVYLTDSVYTLQGLTPNTQYTWMLSAVCDGDTLYSETSSFATPCEVVTQLPYTEDFDNVATNDIPGCWMQINPYNGYPKVTAHHPHSGKSMEFRNYSSSSDGVYAVLPPFDYDLSDLQLSFWTRREGASSGTLSVGYLTDPNNAATFVPVTSFSAAQLGDNSYHYIYVPFSDVTTDSDSTYFIAFKYETSAAWHWYVDDVTVEEIPDCIVPYELTVSGTTDTSATLNWNSNADSYLLYYKVSADSSWTELPNVTLGTNGYVLAGLLPNTTYQWYVAAQCDDSTAVSSVTSSSFKTECGVYAAPFEEAFDAAVLPDCWGLYSGLLSDVVAGTPLTSTTTGWEFSNTNVFGPSHATLNIAGTSCQHWLVSPAIDLDDVALPLLTFDLALTIHGGAGPILDHYGQPDDWFYVLFSTDDGQTWDTSTSVSWSYYNSAAQHPYHWISNSGQTVSIPMSDYVGQTVRIAFYGQSTIANGNNDLHIDNVFVGETPLCMAPSLVAAGNITDTSAVITWSENGTAEQWIVEYGPAHFTPGTGTQTTVYTTPSVTLHGLQDNTHYDVYVTARCSDVNYSDSAMSSFTTLLTPVALPYSTDFSDTADRNWRIYNGSCVNRWTIGSVNGAPALYITNDSVAQPAQYTVTSTSVVSAMKKFVIGTTRDFLVSFDVNLGGETQYDYLKLFFSPEAEEFPAETTTFNVDYAGAAYSVHAADFAYYMSPTGSGNYYYFNNTGGNTVHVELVLVNPYFSYATSGSVANLVFLWCNDYIAGTQPGPVISNVSVTPYPCTFPDGVGATNITTTSADFSVLSESVGDTWDLKYKAAADSVWTVLHVTTPQYTLTGLTPSTTYQVQVRRDCGNGEVSLYFPYHLPYNFTTAAPVVLPTPVTEAASNITQTSASLYASVTNPDLVTIVTKGFVVRNLTTGVESSVGVEGGELYYGYNLTDLTPGTGYAYKAYITLEDDTTLYGNELSFTTLSGDEPDTCATPTDLYEVIMLKDGAGIHVCWTDQAGASQWNLQYRPQNGEWSTVVVTGEPCYAITGLTDDEVYEIRVQAVCSADNLSEWSASITATATHSGIGDHIADRVILFPNPAKDYVDIRVDGGVSVTAMEVLDVYGKVVRTIVGAHYHSRINVAGLADGMYFVRVATEAGVVTKTFVKQ